eukprot:jgi/Botrbrau1/11844/Bobra.0175s0007.3
MSPWSAEWAIICRQQDHVHVQSASWTGIMCNDQDHVIALCLAGYQLTGRLPSEWAALSQLRFLDLSDNQLEGSLPSEWEQLKSLAILNISSSQLNGTLPAQWMGLEGLTMLYLWGNSLVGSLPGEWGQLSRLTDLQLDHNSLSGTLPAHWMGMENLTRLLLWNNSLVGSLPSQWGQLRRLSELDIGHNYLNGTLPAQWEGMENLTKLYLGYNSLTRPLPRGWVRLMSHLSDLQTDTFGGTLPAQSMGMPVMEKVSVRNNRLVGSLPGQWGRLIRLRDLDLGQNNLSGTLPAQWMGMTDLTTLSLGNNRLVGTLPSEWGHLKRLAALDLKFNLLNGTLPTQWRGMDNLTALVMFGNGLVGSLPSAWGQLRRLASLNLRWNLLNGTLPTQWGGMEDLEWLSLRDNSLVGSLPSEWGQLGHLINLNMGHNHLSGTLPAQWAGMANLTALMLQGNNLSGTVPWREWAGLTKLMDLELASNRLTGSLPSDVRYPAFTFLSSNYLSGSFPSNVRGAVLLNVSGNSLSGALPDPLTAPDLEALYIGGNPGLRGPVPDCWLYHRACFPRMSLFSDGGLLRESASSYSWRWHNCRDELAFKWGTIGNISDRITQFLDILGDKTDIAYLQLQKEYEDIGVLCSNKNVPQVLGGLWGCLLALVLGGYATRKVVIPRWHAFLKSKWGSGGRALADMASMASASIYWYDWVTDVLVIQTVWPAWTGGLLLAFALLNYVVSGWLVVLHALRHASLVERPPPRDRLQVKLTLWTVGWPLITAVMPLLDTVVLLLSLLQDTYMPFVQIRGLDIEGFTHMRDLVKALTTSLPTAVLTSVVYAMGNSPEVGLVYTKGVFVASMVGSLTLVLWAWYSSLFMCHVEGIGMREFFRRVCSAQTLFPDGAKTHPHPAAPPRLSFVTNVTAPRAQIAGHQTLKPLWGSVSAAGRRAEAGFRSFAAAGAASAVAGPASHRSVHLRRPASYPGCQPYDASHRSVHLRRPASYPGCQPYDFTSVAEGRDHQRIDKVTDLQRVHDGQSRHAGHIFGQAVNTDCSFGADPNEAGGPATAAPGECTSRDSQSAQGTADVPDALAYDVKYWALRGLQFVVKTLVVLGPVAAIILLEYYQDPSG